MTRLNRLTERIWLYPYEEERDRPNLGYIRGDRWSLAVDAGHSRAHTDAFYRALEEAGLPLPSLTVLTHWHWDHTFGMHAVHGLCLAGAETDRHLRRFRDRLNREGPDFFLAMHPSIRREYSGNLPVIVIPADLTYSGEMTLDPGNCPVRVFEAASPHTNDATLVEAAGEGVLFLGDACCDTFETGEKNPDLCARLAGAIRASHARTCVEGHWIPLPVDETIRDLLDEEQK